MGEGAEGKAQFRARCPLLTISIFSFVFHSLIYFVCCVLVFCFNPGAFFCASLILVPAGPCFFFCRKATLCLGARRSSRTERLKFRSLGFRFQGLRSGELACVCSQHHFSKTDWRRPFIASVVPRSLSKSHPPTFDQALPGFNVPIVPKLSRRHSAAQHDR